MRCQRALRTKKRKEDHVPTPRQSKLDVAFRRVLAELGGGTAAEYLIAVASNRTQADPREVIEPVEAVSCHQAKKRTPWIISASASEAR